MAAVLHSRAPAHSWLDTAPVVGRLHARDHLVASLVLATVGVLLLTWAWVSLVRRVTGDPEGVRLVRWATAAWSVPLLLAPPLFSNDGWSYVATGYLAGHGLSPYDVTPSVLPTPLLSGVDPVWRMTTSPYGPLPLAWGGLVSNLTSDPWLLLYAYRLLACAGLVLLALAVPRLARRAGLDPARASALAVASPLVLVHGIGGLHNDILVVGLVAAAFAVSRREAWLLGAVLAGAAAAVKLPGGLAAVGVVLLSLVPAAGLLARMVRSLQVAAVALGTLLGVSVLSGLGIGWIGGLASTANEPAHLAPSAVVGLWLTKLLRLTGPPGRALVRAWPPIPLAKDIGLVLLAGVLAWLLLRRRVGDDGAALVGGAGALLAATVLSPALHYWYFLWCLPLLVCVPLRRGPRWAALALLGALGPLAVADPALHIPWLSRLALWSLLLAPLLGWAAAARTSPSRTPASVE